MFYHLNRFGRRNVLMILEGYEQETVPVADLPPSGDIRQIHRRITATVEAYNERYGAVIEYALVVIREIADLVRGFFIAHIAR